MELQQQFSVSVNEYEEGAGDAVARGRHRNDDVITEDLYQNFQRLATHGRLPDSVQRIKWNYTFLLFAVNIFISICILAIVSSNSSHNKETQPTTGQKEVWFLHKNVFYLFWSGGVNDCRTAQTFCQKRNASLAVLSVENEGWLKFKTEGKPFFISRDSSELGSGDAGSPPVDDEDSDCDTLTSDSKMHPGFVCVRRADETL